MLNFLLNDKDDGHFGGFLDMAEVQLLQNGWIYVAPR